MLSGGSVFIGGLIAQVTFWVLLVFAWKELGPARAGIFLVLWVAGEFGLPYWQYGGPLVTPYVAVLDIVLVFLVFKGDVRLH